MTIATSKVGLFNRPVGLSAPEGKTLTLRDVRSYLNQDTKLPIYKRLTYGTYGGLGLFLLGVVSWFIGSKSDNNKGKWFGRITTFIGAIIATIGRLISLDSKPLELIQNKLLFQPSKELGLVPKEIQEQEVSIKTKDGETLHGYFLKAKEDTDKTIIYLHGNAGNVGSWHRAGVEIQGHIKANVLVVDYRGYGKSTGKPSREGVITDAEAMYEYLTKEKNINGNNISIFGISVGGAIGIELATRLKKENKPLRSLILQSSFTSLRDVVKNLFPYLPVFLVRNDLLNSLELIRDLNIPILISHGDKDEIIPYEYSKKLYETANSPKKLVTLKGAHHNDTREYFTDEYLEELRSLVVGTETQTVPQNRDKTNPPYVLIEPPVTNSSFPPSSIEAVASKNRLNARDFTRLAKEMNVEHIGNPPDALLECGLSKEDTLQRIDEIIETIRKTKCLDNYDFKLNNENISLEKIKGGMQGLVYKLKIKGQEFAVKIYGHSAYASQDIAMGTHYLSYQPFKDHVNFYCGSLKGCWVLDEFIPTNASASNRAGRSWFEHVKYFGIINGDLGRDGYNCLGKDKSIVIDRGEEIFDIKGSIKISTIEDYKAVLQHPISSIRAEAPGLLFQLGGKELEMFKLSMEVPEARLKALDILLWLEEHEMPEAISIAAKCLELKEELIKVLNEIPDSSLKKRWLEYYQNLNKN